MERYGQPLYPDSNNWKYAVVFTLMLVLAIPLTTIGGGWPGVAVVVFVGLLAVLLEMGVTTVEAHRRLLRKTRRIIGRVAWYAFVGLFLVICLPLAAPQAYRHMYARWLRWRNDPIRIAKRGRRAIDSLAGRTWW